MSIDLNKPLRFVETKEEVIVIVHNAKEVVLYCERIGYFVKQKHMLGMSTGGWMIENAPLKKWIAVYDFAQVNMARTFRIFDTKEEADAHLREYATAFIRIGIGEIEWDDELAKEKGEGLI